MTIRLRFFVLPLCLCLWFDFSHSHWHIIKHDRESCEDPAIERRETNSMPIWHEQRESARQAIINIIRFTALLTNSLFACTLRQLQRISVRTAAQNELRTVTEFSAIQSRITYTIHNSAIIYRINYFFILLLLKFFFFAFSDIIMILLRAENGDFSLFIRCCLSLFFTRKER